MSEHISPLINFFVNVNEGQTRSSYCSFSTKQKRHVPLEALADATLHEHCPIWNQSMSL